MLAIMSKLPIPQWGETGSWLTLFFHLRSIGFPDGSAGKNLPTKQETQKTRVQSLGREDPLEDEMATHSSILS